MCKQLKKNRNIYSLARVNAMTMPHMLFLFFEIKALEERSEKPPPS